MDHRLIEGLMEAIAPLIKTYVDDRIAKDVAPLQVKLKEYESRSPEKGEPGKDADPALIAETVEEAVAKAMASISLPKDGKDTDIEVVRAIVAEQIAEMPPAAPGKDADPVDLDEVAARAAKLIPTPVDGKSVTVEDVRPLIEELVSAIPVPVNGKDADPVDLDEVASRAAKLIPAPIDGKSVSVDDVRPLLEEMVSALPKPENGKDADPAEVAALIVEDVAKLIPPPQDGKSVSIEDVEPLIEEAVGKRLPNLFYVDEDGVLVSAYQGGETKKIGKVRGEPGVRGASVMDGSVDEAGNLVLRMSDGRILQTGIVRGEPGEPGRHGNDGKPGRDAHEIQILPGIDENKSYIEGVVAAWRGGLIRSVRQTDPIIDGDIVSAGWKVHLRGIAEEHEEQVEDGRFIERTTVYTDGTEYRRRHKTATPIYQGVWREGADFLKGDVVTWAGSSFIAQRDTSDKPETTDAWKLATKRGRDGKDGRIDRPPPVVKLNPDKR